MATGPRIGGAFWIWSPDSSAILLRAQDNSLRTAYLLDPTGKRPATRIPWDGDNDIDWQRLAP